MAALERRFRWEQGRAWLDAAGADAARRGLLPLPPGTVNRTVRCADAHDAEERHARFRVLLLRRAYPLVRWLPLHAVLNLARVDVDPQGRFVLVTLVSGTQLLDTGSRVTVRGTADDIAVTEMVACCARRGWTHVAVTGDDAFRVAASRELLRRGIEVADCPLPLAEQEALRAGGRPSGGIPGDAAGVRALVAAG